MVAKTGAPKGRGPGRGGRQMRGRGGPSIIDAHVGARVRLRRTLLGMSQEKLGQALGLTFQQVQKYERGANRIGASRLYELCKVLDVPVSFFFDDMGEDLAKMAPSRLTGMAEPPVTFEPDPMAKRETLELVRAYYKITDPNLRKRIFELTKSLASAQAVTEEVG